MTTYQLIMGIAGIALIVSGHPIIGIIFLVLML